MKVYSGIDLHSNSNYVGIVDSNGKRIFNEKLPNDVTVINQVLAPFGAAMQGVVVESTYNWYWLVDGLMAAGHAVHLANPAAIQKDRGLKYLDDKHDAFWLAEMLRLNILPEGYIYPKEERPLRDLLRKRSHLVALRSSLLLSLGNIINSQLGTSPGDVACYVANCDNRKITGAGRGGRPCERANPPEPTEITLDKEIMVDDSESTA